MPVIQLASQTLRYLKLKFPDESNKFLFLRNLVSLETMEVHLTMD